ncbi:MAG: DUF2085 domain-containing protein [Chloroflexota bacterium]
MIRAYLYVHKDQPETELIKRVVAAFQDEFPHIMTIINIESDNYLASEYDEKAPVLDIGPYRLQSPFSEDEIAFAFAETQKKLNWADKKGDRIMLDRFTQPLKMTGSDKFSLWFSKHYMLLFNLVVFLYVGLPFMAPVFMKANITGPANVIYKIYKPLCHQLAFRSWFLFGEQTAYPRELANVTGLMTYGEVSGNDEFDIAAAREFNGNEVIGYKVAFCQRDIAIYAAILLFGLLFSITGKRIRPVPWYVWLIIGIVPIGIDGVSQLLSQTGLSFLAWLPLRESSPLLRTISGGLFGFFTAWYGYPFVEESVAETRSQMQNKLSIIKQIPKED